MTHNANDPGQIVGGRDDQSNDEQEPLHVEVPGSEEQGGSDMLSRADFDDWQAQNSEKLGHLNKVFDRQASGIGEMRKTVESLAETVTGLAERMKQEPAGEPATLDIDEDGFAEKFQNRIFGALDKRLAEREQAFEARLYDGLSQGIKQQQFEAEMTEISEKYGLSENDQTVLREFAGERGLTAEQALYAHYLGNPPDPGQAQKTKTIASELTTPSRLPTPPRTPGKSGSSNGYDARNLDYEEYESRMNAMNPAQQEEFRRRILEARKNG